MITLIYAAGVTAGVVVAAAAGVTAGVIAGIVVAAAAAVIVVAAAGASITVKVYWRDIPCVVTPTPPRHPCTVRHTTYPLCDSTTIPPSPSLPLHRSTY